MQRGDLEVLKSIDKYSSNNTKTLLSLKLHETNLFESDGLNKAYTHFRTNRSLLTPEALKWNRIYVIVVLWYTVWHQMDMFYIIKAGPLRLKQLRNTLKARFLSLVYL